MPTPRKLLTRDDMCCGHKRCPVVEVYEDGTVQIADDGKVIEFTAEQADRLEAVLSIRRTVKEVL